nr:hypothetical protein Iba_chr03bCG4620 [Ipomoea batatas]
MASSEYGSSRPGHLTPENEKAMLHVSFGMYNLNRWPLRTYSTIAAILLFLCRKGKKSLAFFTEACKYSNDNWSVICITGGSLGECIPFFPATELTVDGAEEASSPSLDTRKTDPKSITLESAPLVAGTAPSAMLTFLEYSIETCT